jgi:hypothetical protein
MSDRFATEPMEMKLESVVRCPMMNPAAFRPLEECETCQHHKEKVELAPEQNGRPPVLEVVCTLPTRRRAENLLRKVTDGPHV